MTEDLLPENTLIALLDELIPARSEALPGAGSLGTADLVKPKLGEATPLVASGLEALDAKAVEQGATDFAALSAEARTPIVQEVGTSHPGFLEVLIFHVYGAYYQNAKVAPALGLKSGPPFPGGYELEPGDLGLLDPVRSRGKKMFRDV